MKSIKIWLVRELAKRVTFSALGSALTESCKLRSETVGGITRLRADISLLCRMYTDKAAKPSITSSPKVDNVTTDLLAGDKSGVFGREGASWNGSA